MKKIMCRLYPGDRHEILNELDRKKVYQDLYEWLQRTIREKREAGEKVEGGGASV